MKSYIYDEIVKYIYIYNPKKIHKNYKEITITMLNHEKLISELEYETLLLQHDDINIVHYHYAI